MKQANTALVWTASTGMHDLGTRGRPLSDVQAINDVGQGRWKKFYGGRS